MHSTHCPACQQQGKCCAFVHGVMELFTPCRTLLLSSDHRMIVRGGQDLLSGDDSAMQKFNLAGMNE